MPAKKKSIFRQPGAKHFQLVHRSQRDPLIHDPEASKHVLKEVKRGKSRQDLESLLPSSQITNDISHNIGEASQYGIYYDDTEYDYMQHLREVGVKEDGVESVLIEAPTTSKGKGKAKDLGTGIQLKEDGGLDLPPEALPSTTMLPQSVVYDSHQAVPTSLMGLQPDMDPHLRQVLEALEDDAFVDDDLAEADGDDFFGELVKDGERDEDEDEEPQWEFDEWGLDEEEEDEKPVLSAGGATTSEEESDEAGWEERFKAFKKSQTASALRDANLSDDEDDEDEAFARSEGGDTIGTLRTISMSVIGGKKRKGRRAGAESDASGYSMSSSSMYRNEALLTLDERFDQMMMKEYGEDDDEEYEEEEEDHAGSDEDEAPALLTSRSDFESMMSEFLDEHELLGRKMRPKLAGDTGAEKLDTLRRAMGLDDRVRVAEGDYDDEDRDEGVWDLDRDDGKDRWDCETILSTYSNLENHPRIIKARGMGKVPKIKLDAKTGFPVVEEEKKQELSDSGSDTDTPSKVTITRPKDETAEEKRARKAAVKANKQARRVEKKTTKEQFGAEKKKQMKTIRNKENRLKKL